MGAVLRHHVQAVRGLAHREALRGERLADRGLAVTLVPDIDVATLNTKGVALVFVSPSVLMVTVATLPATTLLPVSAPLRATLISATPLPVSLRTHR